MRPVPGAFMHTPAVASRFGSNQDPARRRLFDGGLNQQPGPHLDHALDAHVEPQQPAYPPLPNAQLGGAAAGVGGAPAGAAQLPPPPPQSPTSKAARYINNALATDRQYPELEQYCKRKYAAGLSRGPPKSWPG
jgi:nuclear pore complex protein Nup155